MPNPRAPTPKLKNSPAYFVAEAKEKPKTKNPVKTLNFIPLNNLTAKAWLSIKKAERPLRFLKIQLD